MPNINDKTVKIFYNNLYDFGQEANKSWPKPNLNCIRKLFILK